MDDEAFFEQLRSICSDAVEAYRAEYPDAPPLTESLQQDLDGPLASEVNLSRSHRVRGSVCLERVWKNPKQTAR
ncbi:hypothetical protein EXE51_08525 [Halorubrum sp. CGM5_25_10-8B]|uniref:hypothetical protein n=1 Tax=Halorubrum sp. CGM5_25_10-8B TaxID=2518115 RepID=UPI0010F95FBC|nr:hypothetical protein [Halorubrum sp. CGM5_25_10-8B]TKX37102.1 hypothetical protein EXE51_08525 [Halorubrum sp. CGM5_25_10-8B]